MKLCLEYILGVKNQAYRKQSKAEGLSRGSLRSILITSYLRLFEYLSKIGGRFSLADMMFSIVLL